MRNNNVQVSKLSNKCNLFYLTQAVLRFAVAEPSDEISIGEQTRLIIFLDHCFTSMEVDLVRTQVQTQPF